MVEILDDDLENYAFDVDNPKNKLHTFVKYVDKSFKSLKMNSDKNKCPSCHQSCNYEQFGGEDNEDFYCPYCEITL